MASVTSQEFYGLGETALKLRLNKVSAFEEFLSKFSSITSNVLIVMDQDNTTITVNTADKSFVKYSQLKTKDIFEEVGNFKIKFGIYSISQMNKALNNFKKGCDFIINYSIYDDQMIGNEITLNSGNELSISLPCASIKIFEEIDPKIFLRIITPDNENHCFDLEFDKFKNISNLFSIDSDNKKLSFIIKDSKVYAKGKSFNLLISNSEITENLKIDIFKQEYSFIDSESHKVYIGNEKIIFKSKDSQTISIISSINE